MGDEVGFAGVIDARRRAGLQLDGADNYISAAEQPVLCHAQFRPVGLDLTWCVAEKPHSVTDVA